MEKLLDEVDIRILDAIDKASGFISIYRLGREIGKGPNTILNRIKKLNDMELLVPSEDTNGKVYYILNYDNVSIWDDMVIFRRPGKPIGIVARDEDLKEEDVVQRLQQRIAEGEIGKSGHWKNNFKYMKN